MIFLEQKQEAAVEDCLPNLLGSIKPKQKQ